LSAAFTHYEQSGAGAAAHGTALAQIYRCLPARAFSQKAEEGGCLKRQKYRPSFFLDKLPNI